MCRSLELHMSCFCDSRVIEISTLTSTLLCEAKLHPGTSLYDCSNVNLKSFEFNLCTLCLSKLLIIRRKIKNILLSIGRNNTNEFYYNNSVCTYIQREIKLEE